MHQAGLKWGEKISIHCGGNPYTKNKGTSCTIQAAEWLLPWLFVDRDDLLDRSKGVETMLEKQSEEYVKEGAEKVTSQDIQTVVDRSDEINRKFSAKGPLKRFIEDGKMLTALIKDWRAGSYRKALYGTIAAAAFALIYVFNPFDIVPDVLPIIGAVDDAAVVGACLILIERDLKVYREWKESQFMLEEGKR